MNDPEVMMESEEIEAATESEEPSASDDLLRGRLTVKRGGVETDECYDFVAPATIGRFDPAMGPIDVDLSKTADGSFVSRKHAKIVFEDGAWRIYDLGSSNGTFLLRDGDFQPVEMADLADGDEIALGQARFIFHIL